jgi:sulfate transport system permease protein
LARGGGFALRTPSVIPGFGLTLGFTLSYLALIVLVPLAALLFRSVGFGWGEF